MFDIKITGDRELSIRLDGIVRELPRVLRNIVNRGALEVKREAMINLSGKVLNRQTGKLVNSIQIERGGTETNPFAIVGTNTIYARIHELGGIIKAKNKPYLWFKVGDNWVRVKQVTIPPRPFLKPAFETAIPKIEQIASEEIGKAIA